MSEMVVWLYFPNKFTELDIYYHDFTVHTELYFQTHKNKHIELFV